MGYEVSNNAVCQLQFEGRHEGQQVMTVMTYRLEGEAGTIDGPTALNELAFDVDGGAGDLYNLWRSCICDNVAGITIACQWIAPVRYAYQLTIPTITNGALNTDAMPPNVAQTVTRRAFNTGRSTISNLKLPGVPREEVVGGFLTDVQVGRLNSFASQSKQEIPLSTGGKLVPITLHRSAPSLGETLIYFYAHNTVRTMHRRTVGLGS